MSIECEIKIQSQNAYKLSDKELAILLLKVAGEVLSWGVGRSGA